MEKYILENQDSFELKDIFDCGQCFRWSKEEDLSYTGVIKQGVINVKKENNSIIFTGILINKNDNFKQIIEEYFDLDFDYKSMKNNLSKIDEYVKESINYGSGIRILRQDLWEMIISYIISANNNIPRIKKIIEAISKKYGKEIEFNNKIYYLFPTIDELKDVSIEDFRSLGTGFRDKRLFNTVQTIYKNEIDINDLALEEDTYKAREILLKLDGVGPKVADCILLFGMHRFDIFPIDVWVRRVMNDLYIHNENEENVNKKELESIAKKKFGEYRGLVQQYLFYWKRDNN